MRDTELPIRGVLLAGGRGRRLGLDLPKALIRVGGTTLYERALETLRFRSSEIVVAAPDDVAPMLPTSPLADRTVSDRPGGGPLAGAAAALEDGGYVLAVVLGVDFPFMSHELLHVMETRLRQHPELRAVVAAPGGRLQPLAGVYSREAGLRLCAEFEAGERSIVRAVERLEPTVLDLSAFPKSPRVQGRSFPVEECFFNLNTPEDLAEAERRFDDGSVRS